MLRAIPGGTSGPPPAAPARGTAVRYQPRQSPALARSCGVGGLRVPRPPVIRTIPAAKPSSRTWLCCLAASWPFACGSNNVGAGCGKGIGLEAGARARICSEVRACPAAYSASKTSAPIAERRCWQSDHATCPPGARGSRPEPPGLASRAVEPGDRPYCPAGGPSPSRSARRRCRLHPGALARSSDSANRPAAPGEPLRYSARPRLKVSYTP